jgi:hypothetical protein
LGRIGWRKTTKRMCVRRLRGRTRGDELGVRVLLIMGKERVLNANIFSGGPSRGYKSHDNLKQQISK